MPTWRDDKILELANQLTYSPAEKRRVQLNAAIDLLPAIDPSKEYPWDFVYFRITNIQLREHIDHTIHGKLLRADLASLIEFLSDTLSIKVEEAAATGDSVMELDDVTKKFSVSSKTIQRWRKQGLIALRYLYPDGRRRLGFLESAVTQFAAANKERVEKSAAFKQLSDEEKSQIIEMAKRLIAYSHPPYQCSIKDLARQIGRTLNRAPETIRYTIRKYDQDHPEAAVFPETNHEPRPTNHEPQTPSHENPEPNTLPLSPPEPKAETLPTAPPAPPDRELKLRSLKIEYVANPLFEHPDADNIILNVLPEEALAKALATVNAGTNAKAADVYMARMPRDLPAFLQDIFRQPLMPQELETEAFRRMNYLKFRPAKMQENLSCNSSAEILAEVESLLQHAAALKNQILQSNLRVAVHVARKHQRLGLPLMELVSDATIWVMRAIEKFDFTRPVKFSTYAGYAIMKNFARDRVEQLTRRDSNVLTGQQEVLNALGERGQNAPVGEQIDAANLQSDLLSVIDELPERERELLSRHYGLDQTKPALSLSQLGDEMGITKARVRQLETRALRRLRLLMEARQEKLLKSAAKPK